VLHFYSQGAIDKALQRIGRSLHEGYMLAFTPPAESRIGFHDISVRLKNPTHTANHRKQYYYE